MKSTILSLMISLFSIFSSKAQSSNYVGNWETTSAIAFFNNSFMKIKILATSDPNVLIITKYNSPKKKHIAKYDEDTDKAYLSFNGTQLYVVYKPDTDMLEIYKTNNDTFICDLTRF